MITGKDDVSVKVLREFREGTDGKIADVAKRHGISLDQAKRLKRYANYLRVLQEHCSTLIVEQFQVLGLKGLALAPLFKEKDFDALANVLSQTTADTSREELGQLVVGVKEKSARIEAFLQELDAFKSEVAARASQLSEALDLLGLQKQEMLAQLPELSHYPPEAQAFLQEYIGPSRNGWALRKRLDSGFRRVLTKKGILYLNQYIWEIRDMDSFVEEYLKRLKRNYRVAWDFDIETTRNPLGPNSEEYEAVKSMQEELREIESEMKRMERQIRKDKAELQAREKEFHALKNATLQSFEEASLSSDAMSERDLLRHADLQTRALKWLYMQGGVACSEVTLPNKKRADVVGYLPSGEVVIIEVKVSYQDYKRDEKWQEYLPYCDRFYFAMAFSAEQKGAGVLEPVRQSLEVRQEDELAHKCEDREEMCRRVNRLLCKRFVYGF